MMLRACTSSRLLFTISVLLAGVSRSCSLQAQDWPGGAAAYDQGLWRRLNPRDGLDDLWDKQEGRGVEGEDYPAWSMQKDKSGEGYLDGHSKDVLSAYSRQADEDSWSAHAHSKDKGDLVISPSGGVQRKRTVPSLSTEQRLRIMRELENHKITHPELEEEPEVVPPSVLLTPSLDQDRPGSLSFGTDLDALSIMLASRRLAKSSGRIRSIRDRLSKLGRK